MNNKKLHKPVMLDEVVEYLAPKAGEVYVDGTFGAGGYTRAFLEEAKCRVIAIDRDPTVKEIANDLEKEFPNRIELLYGNFGDMDKLLKEHNVQQVDGVVLDIGVSSMQLDQADRGFSFSQDGPLDMRMSRQGMTAADFVNESSEKQLADVIYQYGGERKSRQIAKAIVQAREEQKFSTTKQLADIVRKIVRFSNDKIDPATRTFQAIRIWINDELLELENALKAAEKILLPGGRIVVVTFHSLEDKIVKKYFADRSGKKQGQSRHLPFAMPANDTSEDRIGLKLLTRKAVKPSESEVKANPRSRSAKLRAAIKISVASNNLDDNSNKGVGDA